MRRFAGRLDSNRLAVQSAWKRTLLFKGIKHLVEKRGIAGIEAHSGSPDREGR
jgi:hypothetical protein